MDNFVEMNYSYGVVKAETSEKALFVFERLMEVVEVPHGIEVDNLYYSTNFAEMLGGTVPAPILTALVNRGMLHCDGKVNGKNAYAITEEIYDYYKNTYKPGLDKHEERMNRMANKFLTLGVEGN
jgi:hypothetical protein